MDKKNKKDQKGHMIGSYYAKVSGARSPVVQSDRLPIFGGIKVYPLRYGIYQRDCTSQLKHLRVGQADSDESYFSYFDKNPQALKAVSNKYPHLDECYSYFAMPLRSGWLYVVSKYAKGIYEYKHIHYSYHLSRFYQKDRTEVFPNNTTYQHFIQCAEQDEIFLHFSEVRLEECFLRSRFFDSSGELRLVARFQAARWLDRSDKAYDSNLNKGRIELKDLAVAVSDDVEGLQYRDIIDKLCNETTLNARKKKRTKRIDAFVLLDDVLGLSEQLVADLQMKHIELQAAIKSFQTGISFDRVLERIMSLDADKAHLVHAPAEVLFPDEDCREAQAMHTMAFLQKSFFYETDAGKNKDLRKYIDTGKDQIDRLTLDGILGLPLRKELCREVDEYRKALHLLLESKVFRRYCRMFLDRDEYPYVEEESSLPFVVPERFTFDFFEEGASYHAMLSQVKSDLFEIYSCLQVSPYALDGYLKGENKYSDLIPGLSAEEEDELKNKAKQEVLLLVYKEVICMEYFGDRKDDNKLLNKAFIFHGEGDWAFEWQTVQNCILLWNVASERLREKILDRRVPAKIQYELKLDNQNRFSMTTTGKLRGSSASMSISQDKIVAFVTDPKGNIEKIPFDTRDVRIPRVQHTKNGPKITATRTDFEINNRQLILSTELYPKANWKAVQNAEDFGRYLKLKGVDIADRIGGSSDFWFFAAIIGVYLLKKSLDDPDRSGLRKANDVAIQVFAMGALSQNLYQFFSDKPITSYCPNPLRKLNGLVQRLPRPAASYLSPKITASVTRLSVFRFLGGVANLLTGAEAMAQGVDLYKKGNTTTGGLMMGMGLGLVGVSGVFLIFPSFWPIYFALSLVLLLALLVVSFFVDSELEVFLKKTVFSRNHDFAYQEKDSIAKALMQVHNDIQALLRRNRKLSRPNNLRYMSDFQVQLERFNLLHLFVPSFQQCSCYSSYQDLLYAPHKYKHIYDYPARMGFSIKGNLSFLAPLIDRLELSAYLSTDSNPKYRENMEPLLNFSKGRQKVKFGQDSMEYVFIVQDYIEPDMSYIKLGTYPFFVEEEYFIFLYIRFYLKQGEYLPLPDDDTDLYIRCRYRLNRKMANPNRDTRSYDYEISNDRTEVLPFPSYKSLK